MLREANVLQNCELVLPDNLISQGRCVAIYFRNGAFVIKLLLPFCKVIASRCTPVFRFCQRRIAN